jgi:hydrogenase nickel incorporation protein HypA/HybF
MHEVGLIQDALAHAIDAASRAGAPRIEGVNFVISDEGYLTEEVIRDLFEVLSTGTIAEGARVEVEVRPGGSKYGRSELFLESILISDERETVPCA